MKEYNFQIDQLNLNDEFSEVPAMVSYYCEQYANARYERDTAKAVRERVEAEVHLEVKQMQASKCTVADIAAMVACDQRVQSARMFEIERERDFHVATGNARAAEAKKDALQSLGAHVRADMKLSGLNTKEYNFQMSDFEGSK